MIKVAEALRIVPLSSAPGPDLIETARELLREYGHFVLASTGPARLCAARLDPEISDPERSYTSQHGEMLLAFIGEEAAGCAGYRALAAPVPEHACELKRMWVRSQFRGISVGRRLAEAVLQRAAKAGYEAIYLDTEPEAMGEALRLYLRLGFDECPAYTEEKVSGLRFFRRSLT